MILAALKKFNDFKFGSIITFFNHVLARVRWNLALDIRESKTLASCVGPGFPVEILTLLLSPTKATTFVGEREQV